MTAKTSNGLPREEIHRFTLKNGLTVVMMKTGVAPVVAVEIWYKVGSKNEQPGKSGFAHLFEHMMFEGSANVGKSEHMKLISDVGGTMNGTTSKDRTNYYEVVPANQLRLALWLEADRMRALAVTEENFENQRATVKEERRLRVDNAPYAAVFYEKLDELVYENWAYKHSVIGSMADLDKATVEDIIKFHDTYYKPNNAVLAVVGDIDVDAALALVKEYFEDIPAGEPPPDVDLSEPPQPAQKRMVWKDPFAPLPGFVCAFHIPAHGEKDTYAMEIIEKMLFDGQSSRLYRRFIEQDQSLLHIYGGVDSKMGPGIFYFFGQLKEGKKMAEVEAAYFEELVKLREQELSEEELQKVKNQFKSDFISKFSRVNYKANLLCFYTVCFDDPELIFSEINRYLALTPADIRAAAQRHFRTENSSVIEIYPETQ